MIFKQEWEKKSQRLLSVFRERWYETQKILKNITQKWYPYDLVKETVNW